jgi:hypothetical protein
MEVFPLLVLTLEGNDDGGKPAPPSSFRPWLGAMEMARTGLEGQPGNYCAA